MYNTSGCKNIVLWSKAYLFTTVGALFQPSEDNAAIGVDANANMNVASESIHEPIGANVSALELTKNLDVLSKIGSEIMHLHTAYLVYGILALVS